MLRKFIPQSIFARFILIIMIPTLLTQLIATYIFFNRHWYSVSSSLVSSLVGEIAVVLSLNENFPSKAALIQAELPVKISIIKGKKLYLGNEEVPYSLKRLQEELANKIKHKFKVSYDQERTEIIVNIQSGSNIITIKVPKSRINNPTTHIFILWLTCTGAFFFLLSLIFSRNQIRPIIKLARAAELFGKGITITNFKPEGALEVRRASIAFLKMQDRIQKQIAQRTEMLSGISHDLRTPLTRMKLRLALMKNNKYISELQMDINEMEKMVDSYLEYMRGEGEEKIEKVNIKSFFNIIIKNYQFHESSIELVLDKSQIVFIKKNALARVVKNLIDNSIRYATKIRIKINIRDDNLNILIEDNGPGIPEAERENIFKPFYRIESSRNPSTGGVGLGLSIVKTIVANQGGEIMIGDSNDLGGASITVHLPLNRKILD